MNNINEIIAIIKSCGGAASFLTICDEYQKKNKIVLSSNHRIILTKTLNDNVDKVHFDKGANQWCINSNQVSQIPVITTKGGMSVEGIVEILRHTGELIPERYDGSYIWMKKAIEEYAKMDSLDTVDVNDMDFLYALAVGTWKMSVSIKKDRLFKTNLSQEAKVRLSKVIDDVWANATRKNYENHSDRTNDYMMLWEDENGSSNVGMFGTGFMTFSGKLSDGDARSFIKMMTEVFSVNDDDSIYAICEKTINKNYIGKGLKAASASAILHCYKPYSFPILNGNDGHGTFYDRVGIKMESSKKLQTYIENCRRIKEYRDNNFKFRNYRVLDVATWAIDSTDGFDLAGYLSSVTEKAG